MPWQQEAERQASFAIEYRRGKAMMLEVIIACFGSFSIFGVPSSLKNFGLFWYLSKTKAQRIIPAAAPTEARPICWKRIRLARMLKI